MATIQWDLYAGRRIYNAFADVTIPSSGVNSDGVEVADMVPLAVEMPAAWTAATLAIEVSQDGVTFVPVHDESGTAQTLTVGTSRLVMIPNTVAIRLFPFVRFVSSETQAAARVLRVTGSKKV